MTASWSTTERCPTPDAGPCPKESDWADWPGGRRLRLDADPLALAGWTTLAVTGARPGDRVVFHQGAACALDCPTHLDGACFQPIAPVVLGDGVADATGTASLSVPPGTWTSGWLVVQATVPAPVDGSARYLSQPILDRVSDEGPFVGPNEIASIAPATIRSQIPENGWGGIFSTRPLAGRRLVFTYASDHDFGEDEGSVAVTSDSVTTPFEVGSSESSTDTWFATPSEWSFFVGFDDLVGARGYTFDLTTPPLGSPIDWYPDLDCDGHGDGDGVPMTSAVPVLGGSPDPSDCDDEDPLFRPYGEERCGDGIDQDCDGSDRPCELQPGMDVRSSGSRLIGGGSWVVVGDLDGDGISDLTSAGAVFPLDREDHQAVDAADVSGYRAAAGDLTGDGIDDLVVDHWTVQLYPGPLSGAPSPTSLVEADALTAAGWGTAIADLTGDGQADLVLGSGFETTLYAGPLGAPPPGPDAVVVSGGHRVATGDADGDGVADLWIHDGCLYLSPLPAVGGAAAGCGIGIDDATEGALVAGDLDGDGLGDVLVGAHGHAYGLLGPLSGDEAPWLTVLYEAPTASNPTELALVPDRDGDGAPEVVVSSGGRVWWASAAGGTLTEPDGEVLLVIADERAAPPVVGGDFDGDGAGDLALAVPYTSYGASLHAGVIYVTWGP